MPPGNWTSSVACAAAWKRGARELEGAEARLRDAQVSVTAEVARTYFELRGAQAQLAVAHRNVDNQRETLKLTQARLDAGRGTELDTSRAECPAQHHARHHRTARGIDRALHPPPERCSRAANPTRSNPLLAPAHDLPELPHIAAVGDPAGLLRRRPDIRVAERSWPPPPRASASPSAIYFPRSPSRAVSVMPPRSPARSGRRRRAVT